MEQKRFWTFMGISVLLHLLLLLLIFSGILLNLRLPEPETKPNQITLTLEPPPKLPLTALKTPQQTRFADTTGLPQTETPDEQTPFEGEANTIASSSKPPLNDSQMPNQDGIQKPGLEFFNSDYSPENPAKPSASVAKEEPAKPDKPSDKPQPEKATQADTGLQDKLATNPRADIRVVDKTDKEKEPKPEEQAPTQTTSEDSQSRGPPASFSAQKRPNQIIGGAQQGDQSSVAVRESELGRYKAKLYRAIGSRWYAYVRQDTGTIGVGQVKLRFYVQADGKITQIEIAEGRNQGALLAVSRRSVLEVSGQLEPFPESMRRQLGDGYWEEVNFTIY